MAISHRTSKKSAFMWFLDSAPDDKEVNDTSTTTVRQPWRCYWPPKDEKTMAHWLQSEFPEVLSWSFDRNRPFDRPWRTWARSTRAMQERVEGCQYQSLRSSGISSGDSHLRSSSVLVVLNPSSSCEIQTISNGVIPKPANIK